VRFALDEAVYVLEGRGLATVWASDSSPQRTFEWQKHSLFMLPRNYSYQLSNVSGNAPAPSGVDAYLTSATTIRRRRLRASLASGPKRSSARSS